MWKICGLLRASTRTNNFERQPRNETITYGGLIYIDEESISPFFAACNTRTYDEWRISSEFYCWVFIEKPVDFLQDAATDVMNSSIDRLPLSMDRPLSKNFIQH